MMVAERFRNSWKLTPVNIAAMGVGIALYAALNVIFNTIQLPAGFGIALRPSVAIPMFFGFIFGPMVGFVVGFVGNAISDAISWGGFWWNWDIANGLFGLFPGLALLWISEEEMASKKGLGILAVLAVIGSVVGIGFAALTDVLFSIWSTPVENPWAAAWGEFVWAAPTDAVNGAIITPLLVLAYAAAARGRARRIT